MAPVLVLCPFRLAATFSRTSHGLSLRQSRQSLLDRRKAGLQVQKRLQGTSAEHSPEHLTPPRSRTVRALRSSFKYISIATISVACGFAFATYTRPNRPLALGLVKYALDPRPPPTPAQTLSPESYTPPDEATAAINTHILTSPLAAALRTHPNAYTEWRPHLQIPPAFRPINLTGGTLLGPGRIAVPPLFFNDKQGKNMVALFYLGEQLCGHPGVVHGGLLATLLDEGLARCCFPALPNKIAYTASLKVDYRRPAMAERYFVLRAETVKVEGRKAWVKGWIEEMGDESGEGGQPVKLVEAEALYVEPKRADLIKRLYSIGDTK